MCGLCGISYGSEWGSPKDDINALLKGVVERGRDSTGYAWLERGNIRIIKAARSADDTGWTPGEGVYGLTPYVLGHVRLGTNGSKHNNANNHPIRYKNLIGTHNGVIRNDDEIFRDFPRANPTAEVDSEAIWASVFHLGADRGLARLRGSWAVAWVDDRRPQSVCLAKGDTSPLWICKLPDNKGLAWASTYKCLDDVFGHIEGAKITSVPEFTMLVVEKGQIVKQFTLRKTKKANHKSNYWTSQSYGSCRVDSSTTRDSFGYTSDDYSPGSTTKYKYQGNGKWEKTSQPVTPVTSGPILKCVECQGEEPEIDAFMYGGQYWCLECGGKLQDRPIPWYMEKQDILEDRLATADFPRIKPRTGFKIGQLVKVLGPTLSHQSDFPIGSIATIRGIDLSDPVNTIRLQNPVNQQFSWTATERITSATVEEVQRYVAVHTVAAFNKNRKEKQDA